MVAKRPKLQQCIDELTKHFGAQMFQLDSKMARINAALDLLEERCGGIANAVDTWEFAGVPWVSLPKEKGDAEIIAAFRIVEQFNNQFDNLKVTYSALVERKDHQPETLRAGIMKTSDLFEIGTYQHRLDFGKKIVALGMLSNVILRSASPKDKTTWPNICNKTIKYLKEKMQYDIKKLPAALLPCLAADDSVKGSGSVAVPGGSASSSTKQVSKEPKAAIGAEPQVQENQEPPQKKVRKFGKAKAKEP